MAPEKCSDKFKKRKKKNNKLKQLSLDAILIELGALCMSLNTLTHTHICICWCPASELDGVWVWVCLCVGNQMSRQSGRWRRCSFFWVTPCAAPPSPTPHTCLCIIPFYCCALTTKESHKERKKSNEKSSTGWERKREGECVSWNSFYSECE